MDAFPCFHFDDSCSWGTRLLPELMPAYLSVQFLTESTVSLGPSRTLVIGNSWLAMAWRFGKPDIPGNDCLEDLVAKMILNLLGDLLLQRHSGIEHDPQKTDKGQSGVDILMYPPNGIDEI